MPPQIASSLLLIARNPTSGTVRHPGALDRALRSALLAQLALAGAITDVGRAPTSARQEPTGDRILDAVLATIQARPGVLWPRWYRHVAADRAALSQQLVAQGRWARAGRHLGRHAYTDTDPEDTVQRGFEALQVAERTRPPIDGEQACLAILMVVSGALVGRPRPRELRGSLLPLLDVIGPPADPVRHTVQVALATGAQAVRKRRRVLG